MELDELWGQLDDLGQPDVDFDRELTLTKVSTVTLTLTLVDHEIVIKEDCYM